MMINNFLKRSLTKHVFLIILIVSLNLTNCSSKPSSFGIIFTHNYDDIYQVTNNTSRKTEQLTFTPTIQEYPLVISKNGDQIIFEVGFTGILDETIKSMTIERQQHVYILNTSDKQMTDITNILVKHQIVPHGFSMDWSPNEKQFAIVSNEGSGSEFKSFIELVDVDGKNRDKIPIQTPKDIPSLIKTVKWSPDGKKFVLTRRVIGIDEQWKTPGSAILIYDIEAENLIEIASYEDQCFPVAWSPTSRQIVATCSYVPPYAAELQQGPEAVRIFDVENSSQASEYVNFSPCESPSWSPDGKQIAFVCDKKGEKQKGLFVANNDGSGIHEISLGDLGNPAVLRSPTWSPDGAQIIYTAGSDVNSQNIYAIDLTTSTIYTLTDQSAYYRLISVYPLP